MPKINQRQLNMILVPVPPMNEQDRIVYKTERLMSICEELIAGIAQAQSVSERMMEEIVGELSGIRMGGTNGASINTKAALYGEKADLPSSGEADDVQKKMTLILNNTLQQLSNEEPIKIGGSMKAILSEILRHNNFHMTARELWRASGLTIEDFYAQLKIEGDAGLIKEPDPKEVEPVLEAEE